MSNSVLLTTTGTLSPVVLHDLAGRHFVHPTTDLNLSDEFSLAEISDSANLQNAVAQGHVTLKDVSGNSISNVEDIIGNIGGGGTGGLTYAQIHLYDAQGGSESSGNKDWRVKGYNRLDMSLLGSRTLTLMFRGRVSKLNSPGTVRIWDDNNRVVLAELSVDDVVDKWYQVVLSNLPSSGYADIELQVKSSGGNLNCVWAFIEVK